MEHVAALTGRTIHNQGLLKVQLGDQTDAKVLLGTYHSTDVPGEFIWTAGVLTRVMKSRRLPLIYDLINVFFFFYYQGCSRRPLVITRRCRLRLGGRYIHPNTRCRVTDSMFRVTVM